jgi:L-ascorbate metabolism protein UlaG (beta-lactamase superfamily)
MRLRSLLVTLALSAAGPASAAAAEKTEITWYGHAAFTIKTPVGIVLAIDPWFSNPKAGPGAKPPERVDFILVTHGHTDHVGDAIALANRTGARFVGAQELARLLLADGYPMDADKVFATALNSGGTIALGPDVSVTAVPAIHSSSYRKTPDAPAEFAGNPMGFLVRVKDGPTIYHTGDTDVTAEMQLIGERWPVDVLLACIGGHYTMDPVGAARAAALVKAKIIVPMHFGTTPLLTGTPEELQKALVKGKVRAKMVVMKPGETRGF